MGFEGGGCCLGLFLRFGVVDRWLDIKLCYMWGFQRNIVSGGRCAPFVECSGSVDEVMYGFCPE